MTQHWLVTSVSVSVSVYKACNYHIWTLQHIRRVLPLDVAKTLASSTDSSRLDYCNSVLYVAPHSTTAMLQRVRNCLARVVLQRRKTCHAQPEPLLESLHWLPISYRINLKLATLAYKIHSTSQPTYLHQLIPRQFTGSSIALHSSRRPLLQVPRTRTAYGSRAFSVDVPNIWNKLPADVLTANSLPVFHRRPKHICSLPLSETSGVCNIPAPFFLSFYGALEMCF